MKMMASSDDKVRVEIVVNSKFRKTQIAVKENDPPIEVNQRWISYINGKVYRRLRILAKHPDSDKDGRRYWIVVDESPFMNRREAYCNLHVTPEFNLRYVFELEG